MFIKLITSLRNYFHKSLFQVIEKFIFDYIYLIKYFVT